MSDAAGRPVELDENGAIGPQSFIDHTLLHPSVSMGEIIEACRQACEHNFAAVCLPPNRVELARSELDADDRGAAIAVATVVNFPLGAEPLKGLQTSVTLAIENGATEIDLVMNLGAFKDGSFEVVRADIASLISAAEKRVIFKVIIESGLWNLDEVARATRLAVEAGADFVKTSTGFVQPGATVEVVETIKRCIDEMRKEDPSLKEVGIKASGGIRDLETMSAMIRAGATRIGTSSALSIMEEARS